MRLFWLVYFGFVLILVYSLGSSITGYSVVSNSMHCDGESCSAICVHDGECNYGDICCDVEGIPHCVSYDNCRTPLEKELESPARLRLQTGAYALALVLIGILGLYTVKKFN